MYDLDPVLLSARSSYVELSDEERDELSPALHLDELDRPVLVVHGDEESPEFIRQARAFSASLGTGRTRSWSRRRPTTSRWPCS